MDMFIQQLTNALVVGAFYSLIALGYSMVYGIIQLLNFAHGDLYMVGSFVGFTVLSLFSGQPGILGVAVAFLASMLVVGLLGMGVERIAYRPLLKASRLTILITAVGVSLVLENGTMLSYGPSFKVYPYQLPTTGFHIGNATITFAQIGIILISLVLMIGLQTFVHKTLYGKAMRAIAIDQTATSLMGIPVNRIISMTFFIGSALAAAAGMMSGLYYGQINFMMGFIVGLKAFTAAVIGGIGSIPGAMVGGLALGILESLGTIYLGSEWRDVFTFAILILILVLKPTGLLGEKTTERM
ncbi:branched-chain amino acid ABC transporter permease [Fodinisporobacter ferrooxydans]|uniref:Branched-chain amino acid ABC transporter permease n=1 Tax=Fodinisporobacter ferrooxydans TaxID=2901836 RepID=A0ABY4CQ36_9BACL|nr:branched-chain amino acid ABC transporter permease [Alicyclobacillaceae bacterium MYW30-H2]